MKHDNPKLYKAYSDQGRFISEMEQEQSKCLFLERYWFSSKVNGFYNKRCVFVVEAFLKKYVKLWQPQQMPKTYDIIKEDFL